MICDQSTVPLVTQGSPYCVNKHYSLCSCSLITGSNFIDSHISGCNKTIDDLELKFVINGGAELIFNSTFHGSKIDLDKLYSEVQTQYFDEINIAHSDSNDLLLEASETPVNLQKLHDLFSKNKTLYYYKSDKIHDNISVDRIDINPWRIAMVITVIICCFCIIAFCFIYAT